ncbi:MAG TPA: two-component system response regulator NarL [Erwinia persicina]|uniref:Two-component system response regulator NarL n=1 Tax=Erwinia persicina TaxID=55211 RepID=A0A3S7RZQ0_9GAMM|nr:two-component system response regulator NarL [Erwinia persicina]AXU93894.1 two-component system response regulator NarL [Erwinia persicina]MBC3945378.1 two-component system response regulator NarL [Erwinia persicina]MBD8167989.1 two-component system response regulator NarL [Erwinia persicina]MCQ4095444.1 two-component system response regulator NarL [Erwinia persicina]MCQ4099864.1 two-component system response regulator NarL [Erwinia persicina]
MTTQLTQVLSTEPASVLLIDDHPMIRNGLKQLIGLDARLKVVAEASNGVDGVRLAEQHEVDLILLDLNMPGMNGLETLEQLRATDACGHIVVFSVSDYEDDVINALKRGADGYLLKDMEPEALLECLHRAAAGELVLSDTLPPVLAASLRQQRTPVQTGTPEFTTRERDVLRLIAQGMSNKLIARRLGISESTVKVHVKHLLKKLQMKSRVEAAVWALQCGEVGS